MKEFILLLLFVLSASTKTHHKNGAKTHKKNVFFLEPEYYERNINLIKSIKLFLDSIYNMLEPQLMRLKGQLMPHKTQKQMKLREFVKIYGKKFIDMDDFDSQLIMAGLNDALTQQYNNLTDKITPVNRATGKKLKTRFTQWVDRDIKTIKLDVKSVVEDTNFVIDQVIDKIERYLDDNDYKKLIKTMTKAEKYANRNRDVTPVFKKLLNYLCNDKFNNLSEKNKTEIMKDLKLFTSYLDLFSDVGNIAHNGNEKNIKRHKVKKRKYSRKGIGENLKKKVKHHRKKIGKVLTKKKHLNKNMTLDNVHFTVQPF